MSSLLSNSTSKNIKFPNNFGYLTPDGYRALGVVGEVMLVDSSGNELGGLELDAGAGASSGYLGKVTNGDFVTAYASGTTLTCTGLPAGVSAISADDVTAIVQIDNTGAVVQTYTRDEMTLTAAGTDPTTLTVTGATFAATDTFVVYTNIPSGSSSSSSAAAGGGNNTYSNASGDFTATITNATTNITIAGLPFTLEDIHVAAGWIKKIDTSNTVTVVPTTDVSVSGGVITLADADNFVTGDTVVVMLVGPDKAYDEDLDNQLSSIQNPDYAHYTDVEHLIDEEDLGLSDTDDGDGDATHIEVDSSGWSNATVAVGYTAYSIDESAGDVVASCDTDTIVTTNVNITSWAGDVFCAPEVKRFEIDMESYKHASIHYKLSANDDGNSCYFKIYGTNNADADTTDDTDWVDLSVELLTGLDGFDTTQVVADGIGDGDAATAEDIIFIDESWILLKYMIKIVAECEDATPDNDFDVYVKKGY